MAAINLRQEGVSLCFRFCLVLRVLRTGGLEDDDRGVRSIRYDGRQVAKLFIFFRFTRGRGARTLQLKSVGGINVTDERYCVKEHHQF